MEVKLHNYFHQQAGKYYERNCSLIDALQTVRYYFLLSYYSLRYLKQIPQALLHIQKILHTFQEWIRHQEKEALESIKQKYSISDEIWQKLLNDTERLKRIHLKEMTHKDSNTEWDPSFDPHLKETLINILEKNNIHPESIAIRNMDEKNIADKTNLIAETKTLLHYYSENETVTFLDEYTPSTIMFYPIVHSYSSDNQKGVCAHEVQHLVEQHGLKGMMLIHYLRHYYNIDPEELKKTKEYQRLLQIYEAQAEILTAVKDPSIAYTLNNLRKNEYYPQFLYEDHFYHISTIALFWKLHNTLEFLHKNLLYK